TGEPGVTGAQAAALARMEDDHLAAASEPPPANTSRPTISGVASPGQILTAGAGMWTGKRLSYEFQWFRCNPSGIGCVAIQGSKGPTYTVSVADSSSTLVVSAAATSAAG